MAKKVKKVVDPGTYAEEAVKEYLAANFTFNGNNWVEVDEEKFDFDNNTFDGINWIVKEA